jgi:two-component system sensor histidine kinase HydH
MDGSGSHLDSARGTRVWLWTAIGAGIGLFDFGVLWFLDANLTILGRDMTVPVFLSFLIPYGALGWAVGRIHEARAKSDADAATIQAQLTRLERTQRALVQQEKLAGIGRLAAGVAHEVRNPLGVIRASAAMVQESFDPHEDPHRALGFICEEIDRLEGLISGLLTFARPTEIDAQPVVFDKLVERAIALARTDASAHGVELETRFEPGLPPIEGDPDLLCQVVYNLVLNAIQILEGGGRIAVRVSPSVGRTARAAGVRVDVIDDGPGVPAELAEQIFEPFVTTRASGTGLGLPMAMRLIEAHGGRLALVPGGGLGTDGRGACFRIEIPTRESGAGTVEAVA